MDVFYRETSAAKCGLKVRAQHRAGERYRLPLQLGEALDIGVRIQLERGELKRCQDLQATAGHGSWEWCARAVGKPGVTIQQRLDNRLARACIDDLYIQIPKVVDSERRPNASVKRSVRPAAFGRSADRNEEHDAFPYRARAEVVSHFVVVKGQSSGTQAHRVGREVQTAGRDTRV